MIIQSCQKWTLSGLGNNDNSELSKVNSFKAELPRELRTVKCELFQSKSVNLVTSQSLLPWTANRKWLHLEKLKFEAKKGYGTPFVQILKEGPNLAFRRKYDCIFYVLGGYLGIPFSSPLMQNYIWLWPTFSFNRSSTSMPACVCMWVGKYIRVCDIYIHL